ncbi:MAG: hypothetical protein JSU69_02780 [Candidatus Zixiibacteriota bacterium]|nr:MAG: hypothetical protein JSU69_02780 [candidate division Zixibacteria bacterium]
MKRFAALLPAIFLISGAVAQDIDHEVLQSAPKIMRSGLPVVSFKTDNRLFMKALYPEIYANEYKVNRDIRWVRRNDSALAVTWDSLGYTVLAMLEDLSGIKWREHEISISLMKYLRAASLYDPPALPLEGIRMERYIEAAPGGLHQLLNLIKILAGRNIMQVELPGLARLPIYNHPLLDKTAYRFDVTTLTLTLACAEMIIPSDSLNDILGSQQWLRHNPGWELFENHFRYSWMLSVEQPLIAYLSREPHDSHLVGLTYPPRPRATEPEDNQSAKAVRLSAGGGRLGLSVTKSPAGLLEVVDVDTLGLAFANGLMPGDQIKRCNGEVVRNARDLMGKILDKLDTEGVYLIIARQGEELGLLLLPPADEY